MSYTWWFPRSWRRLSKNIEKWLCVPSAGVDYLMKPGVFANEECLLTNSSGAYGVSISEHMIAVSLMMMRRLTEFYEETLNTQWGKPRAQRSLWGSRITGLSRTTGTHIHSKGET